MFFWEILERKSYAVADIVDSSEVTSAMGILFPDLQCRSILVKIEIPCILLFLNRNKNSKNSPKRMHPKLHEALA